MNFFKIVNNYDTTTIGHCNEKPHVKPTILNHNERSCKIVTTTLQLLIASMMKNLMCNHEFNIIMKVAGGQPVSMGQGWLGWAGCAGRGWAGLAGAGLD